MFLFENFLLDRVSTDYNSPRNYSKQQLRTLGRSILVQLKNLKFSIHWSSKSKIYFRCPIGRMSYKRLVNYIKKYNSHVTWCDDERDQAYILGFNNSKGKFVYNPVFSSFSKEVQFNIQVHRQTDIMEIREFLQTQQELNEEPQQEFNEEPNEESNEELNEEPNEEPQQELNEEQRHCVIL